MLLDIGPAGGLIHNSKQDIHFFESEAFGFGDEQGANEQNCVQSSKDLFMLDRFQECRDKVTYHPGLEADMKNHSWCPL